MGGRVDAYMMAIGGMTKAVVYGLVLTALAQGALAGLGYWAAGVAAPLLLGALIDLLALVLSSMFWLLVIGIVVSWLRVDQATVYWLQSLVEPLLRPIRRFIPTVGGLDLSPMVMLLLIKVLEMVLHGWRSAV
jgi:uncharacterized protein YggT (Ycf19 family)